jgi:hypothetical protein
MVAVLIHSLIQLAWLGRPISWVPGTEKDFVVLIYLETLQASSRLSLTMCTGYLGDRGRLAQDMGGKQRGGRDSRDLSATLFLVAARFPQDTGSPCPMCYHFVLVHSLPPAYLHSHVQVRSEKGYNR